MQELTINNKNNIYEIFYKSSDKEQTFKIYNSLAKFINKTTQGETNNKNKNIVGVCPHVAKDLRIKKNRELIAIIPLDNLACAFINDYNKKYKVKVRLRTHDYIDIGCDDLSQAKEIMEGIRDEIDKNK